MAKKQGLPIYSTKALFIRFPHSIFFASVLYGLDKIFCGLISEGKFNDLGGYQR